MTGQAGTAATGRDREYDRFGPWVLEITEEDPLPRLFLPHVDRSDQPLLAIKVPRPIARRDAHPGMDLYDYVVALYEADLLILERAGSEVRSRTVGYRDVRHLSLHEELLRGSLELGIAGRPYALPYNTVSKDIMRRVAELVRARYLDRTATTADLPVSADEDGLSFYFERLLQQETAAGSSMRLLAAQPDATLGDIEQGVVRRLLFGILDKRLLESIHLTDGRELRVIDRGRPFVYRWQSVYGRRETVIPLANVRDTEWDESGDANTTTLTVRTDGGDCRWVFTRDRPGTAGYREWLAALRV